MTIHLDEWQKKVMETKGNICLCSGRQVGKSFVISRKACEYAIANRNKTIMVIASVERQAYLLLEKILQYLENNYKNLIKKGKNKPTKHKVALTNGSVIHCLPTGLTGYGIRGYTVDLLIADEAAFIPEEVWTAVTPMLAVTKGTIILLSTPHGTGSYFHRCFQPNSGFTKFNVSSEDCPRKDQDFLDREKARMSKLQYAQEYLGEFVDDLQQVFPDDLIKSSMKAKRQPPSEFRTYFIGVDVAGMGKDESTFEVIDRTNRDLLIHQENIVQKELLTTQTFRKILQLDDQYNFKRIYIDDGGIGFGVFSQLMEEESTRRKTEALNNSARPLDRDENNKKKILKNDLYMNLLSLMEKGKIHLLDDDNLFQSLKSIQFENTDDGRTKIFGKYTHIAEGLIRAAWCAKDKSLNIYRY